MTYWHMGSRQVWTCVSWAARGALLFVTSFANSGCGHSCTAQGCSPGANVVFSRALDSAKEYDVRVVTESATHSCAVASNKADGCEFSAVWTGSEPTVASDGTRFPPNGFAGLMVPGQPSRIEVTIADQGNVVADGKFETVSYRAVEENGPGCGTCSVGSVSLTIP